MNYAVIDIETVRNPAARFEPKTPDQFPPPGAWSVVCCSLLRLDKDLMPVSLGVLPGNEGDIVRGFASLLNEPNTVLTGFNSRAFDLPVMTARAVALGIPMPGAFARDFAYRYGDGKHLDLADRLTDFGAAPRTSLDTWASIIGAPGKDEGEITGANVGEAIAAGRLVDVQRYCCLDAVRTGVLLCRYLVLRGHVTRPTAARAEEAIKAMVAGKAVAA